MSRTRAERPGICCCFYGTTDSLRAPPRHLFDLLCACVCVCVFLRRRVQALKELGREEVSMFPLCPAPGFVSPFPACGGGIRGNGFEFQANLGPKRRRGLGKWSRSQRRFPGIT